MKMKQGHYIYLQNTIGANADRLRTHRESLKNDTTVKDLEKRFRWDCMWGCGLSGWVANNLYNYLDDTHIDTALKSIVKELAL